MERPLTAEDVKKLRPGAKLKCIREHTSANLIRGQIYIFSDRTLIGSIVLVGDMYRDYAFERSRFMLVIDNFYDYIEGYHETPF